MNPVPVEVFTRAYREASPAGKLLAIDAALGHLARRKTSPLPAAPRMSVQQWTRQVDRLLDERIVVAAGRTLQARMPINAGSPIRIGPDGQAYAAD